MTFIFKNNRRQKKRNGKPAAAQNIPVLIVRSNLPMLSDRENITS